ncbi:replication initiator [Streptomyces sp. NPDC001315]|uniref:replication initiator n=1 Tax=Streptomyces sp. NPDC001315 TaxID=3364562 RepID=UPI003688A890
MPTLTTRTTVPSLEANPTSAFAPFASTAAAGRLPGLVRQLAGLGGCAQPVRLDGYRTEVHPTTGEILRHLDSADLPAGQLLMRCGNRRTTRCPACAEIYRRDTYQLISAGLRGGKTVPDTIATHPRVFATFTAPSFGPVHNRPTRPGSKAIQRCRCGHGEDDSRLGSPLDPERYDYQGAVLWNAHAPALWSRFILNLRREVARIGGLTQRALASVVKVSYAKVAEYQKRGLVHFHAVIRLDGPDTTTPPPAWATTAMLTDAIRTAAARTTVSSPELDGSNYEFAFGDQLDVRPIRSGDFNDGGKITDKAVAAYIAKYAAKGAEGATGTLDRRLRLIAELPAYRIPVHAERMIRTAWQLGARRDLEHLKLRAWAHMLGFRGHFSTKTRQYSTTLTQLREARTDYQRTLNATPGSGPKEESTLVLSHWVYAGTGLTPELDHLAALVTPPTAAASGMGVRGGA